MLYYLPHEAVIVKCFDFAGVDNFSLKRTKLCSFQYCFLATEDAIVNNASKRCGANTQFW